MVVLVFKPLVDNYKPTNDVILEQVIQEALNEPQLKRFTCD
jgi:hypothetical protein